MSEEEATDLQAPILNCKLCSYFQATPKKDALGFCTKANVYLKWNFAPLCLAFSVEGFVRTIEPYISSPPAGKQITKLVLTYDVNKNVEIIKAYDINNELLYTLTFSYNADQNITDIERSST